MSTMSRPHNRSGRQRWGISFQSPLTAIDGAIGLPLTTWPDFGQPCDAEIEELSARKRIVNGQPQIEQPYKITCRWQPGVRASMRIVWPLDDLKRILNIESAYDVKSLHQQLEIVAVEMTPEE